MTRQDELNEAWCKYTGKCSTEIMQALAFALRWCDAHPNWISVEDELPKENEPVLAFVRTTEYEFPFVGIYSSGTWYYTEPIIKDESNVTHWMPLPKVPGKED